MNLGLLLEMASSGLGDRVALGPRARGLTYADLLDRSTTVAAALAETGCERLAFLDVNSEALPLALFSAALAGVPFVPLNYRLADDRLRQLLERTAPCELVVGLGSTERVVDVDGVRYRTARELLEVAPAPGERGWVDQDAIAVLLYTSGTTGEPKSAVLRHRHLASYIMGTVEFGSAGEDEAALVCVPPYHIAGITAVVSSVYAGRRIVYLPQFDPKEWVAVAREEAVTHAMVVPTMLGRILDVVEESGEGLPALRHLSYGGGRMPLPVVERALTLLPKVDLVNAYGLTETSSTVAVLSPADHREAMASSDPAVHDRLGSVGRPLPGVELSIRDPFGRPVPTGETGEIWVRGDQVSGEYLGRGSVVTDDGWFPTNDGGWLDGGGFLYVDGRLDDVIVRGAENLSPGEIEDVLEAHPAVAQVAVVGIPDDEWGQAVAAVIVPTPGHQVSEDELQEWVRARLRSTFVPARIELRDELPFSETGKLLRRVLRAELAAG